MINLVKMVRVKEETQLPVEFWQGKLISWVKTCGRCINGGQAKDRAHPPLSFIKARQGKTH